MRKCIKDKRKKLAKDVRRMIKQSDGKIMLVVPGKSDLEKPFDPFTDKLDPMLIEPDKQEYLLNY